MHMLQLSLCCLAVNNKSPQDAALKAKVIGTTLRPSFQNQRDRRNTRGLGSRGPVNVKYSYTLKLTKF